MSENKTTQSGDASDPLSTLHRMSTTAGASSHEYVAINLMAIAAIALGLGSALVLMSDALLIAPLAALVCGAIALRQIYHSNGTQTGRAMAIIGMLIAIGFASFIGVRALRDYNATNAEQAKIEQVVKELEQKVRAKDYSGTLPLFVDGFLGRKKVSDQIFVAMWRRSLESAAYGDVTGVSISRVVLSPPGEQGERAAGSMLIIAFDRSERPLRCEVMFRKTANDWKIEDVQQIFPAPQPEAPTPPGAAGPGMTPPR